MRERGRHDHLGDAGSVLALVPAAVLVALLLAAIAVDGAIAFTAERRLHAAASAAANDAATYGLDEARYRATGEYRLDPERVDTAVREALDGFDSELVDRAAYAVTIGPDGTTVAVTLRTTADRFFGPPVRGRTYVVDATAEARVVLRT